MNDKKMMIGWNRIGIPIYNAGDSGPPAKRVVALIEAFDSNGERVAYSHGHWREVPEPELTGSGDVLKNPDPQRVDFEPNGLRRTLDVVLREVTEPVESTDACLAYPILQVSEMAGTPLPPGRYRIEISLRGEQLVSPARFTYELNNPPGKRDRIALRALGQ